jgi:hypothetical protein
MCMGVHRHGEPGRDPPSRPRRRPEQARRLPRVRLPLGHAHQDPPPSRAAGLSPGQAPAQARPLPAGPPPKSSGTIRRPPGSSGTPPAASSSGSVPGQCDNLAGEVQPGPSPHRLVTPASGGAGHLVLVLDRPVIGKPRSLIPNIEPRPTADAMVPRCRRSWLVVTRRRLGPRSTRARSVTRQFLLGTSVASASPSRPLRIVPRRPPSRPPCPEADDQPLRLDAGPVSTRG